MTFNKIANIPEEFVPLNFKMDPINHKVVYGDLLENGMIVVLEEPSVKRDPKNRPQDGSNDTPLWSVYDEQAYLRESRWCLVESLRRRGDIIQFIGIYSDGTQASRQYNESYCWYVLIDSM